MYQNKTYNQSKLIKNGKLMFLYTEIYKSWESILSILHT